MYKKFLHQNKFIFLITVCALIFFSLILFSETNAQPKNYDYGIFDIPVDERTWPALDTLGVGWIREQFRIGEPDINEVLPFYSRIFSEGYGLLLTLYHRDSTNITDMESYRKSTRGGYPAADTTKYKNLVFKVVGTLAQELVSQGKNPNNFLMIQFCNEVIPTDIVPDNETRFWHGTSGEYLETLAVTYNAVKSAQGFDIPIVNAGISSLTLEELNKFDNGQSTDDSAAIKLYNFNDRVLREGKFDWADVHLRHAKENIIDKINWVKERWDGKLAATEFAGPDPRTGIPFTEETQASELVERMQIASASGVDIIFWSHLVENPAVDSIYFQEGLIEYETWRKKPAYYAYSNYLKGLTGIDEETEIPHNFVLYQNYPNPFNPSTKINYTIAKSGNVKLEVFDSLGRKVKTLVNKFHPAGNYSIIFNANNLSSGNYFYRIEANGYSETKKMILVK